MEVKLYREVNKTSEFIRTVIDVCRSISVNGVIKMNDINGYCSIYYAWRTDEGVDFTYVGGCSTEELLSFAPENGNRIELPHCMRLSNGICVQVGKSLYV